MAVSASGSPGPDGSVSLRVKVRLGKIPQHVRDRMMREFLKREVSRFKTAARGRDSMKTFAREQVASRGQHAAGARAWLAAKGVLTYEQHARAGHVDPMSELGLRSSEVQLCRISEGM